MKKYRREISHLILLLAFAGVFALLLATMGASTGTGLQPGRCTSYVIDSTSDDWYIATSGRAAVIQFEPDTASSGTGTEVSVYACTEADINQCEAYYFDSDFDGIPDTNVLDGLTWPSAGRGIRIDNVGGYILLDTTAYADDGKLIVCGQ